MALGLQTSGRSIYSHYRLHAPGKVMPSHYLQSVLGGALIGAAAVLAMAGLGRIAGVSGIASGLLRREARPHGWRLAFLAGLLSAPLLSWLARGDTGIGAVSASWPIMVAAGLLVGVGTGLGSGCTSGHGVCGIARWSPRSLAATATFMLLGFVTVYLARHVLTGSP
jgi:uncharacterized protein